MFNIIRGKERREKVRRILEAERIRYEQERRALGEARARDERLKDAEEAHVTNEVEHDPYGYDAAEQDAKMEPLTTPDDQVYEVAPHDFTVGDALDFLAEQPRDAALLICAHGFRDMAGQAWMVSHFAPVEQEEGQRPIILIEGAGDPGWAEEPISSDSEPTGNEV